MKDLIRVRFAPSPTGPLHVGGARTALFNWLFARSKGGKFILRIEDTDRERSKKEFEESIVTGLEWLGLTWDEFYRQSERSDIYRDYLLKLIQSGEAYYCFCTKEDLEAEKTAMKADGLSPKYSGRCRSISKEEAKSRVEKEKSVIRFVVPEKEVSFNDLIKGDIKFNTSLIGDIVIAKSLDQPLFNFAVVVDDGLMEITHVIRGEDHIPNTPKQILIAEALGFDIPRFGHMPLILNTDRSKMSKRFADVAMSDYIRAGYLKDAMMNFLAFLGWHPKEEKEIMTRQELVDEFSLERMQKAGAVFNIEKLDWMNGYYINKLSDEDFIIYASNFVPSGWKLNPEIAASVKSRIKKFNELRDLIDFYFELPDYDTTLLRWKESPLSMAREGLREIASRIEVVGDNNFNKDYLEKTLLEAVPKDKRGDFFWPLRVSLSGKKTSPPPFEIMGIIGRTESLNRIKIAESKIAKNSGM
ncbi:MAG TPA: glutamate--tRNA ligase [Candidatus Paceibacterota bacterium]